VSPRPLFFYSAWGLGYHNPEAERKAVALREDGWDVLWMTGVGTLNPRLHTLGKAVRAVGAAAAGSVRGRRSGVAAAAGDAAIPEAGLLVVPPRQLRAARRLNAVLVERQLRRLIADWPSTLAWVRYPTPELVDVLGRLRPAGIVYDYVDAFHVSPGIKGRWARVHDRAERALVAASDLCVTPNEVLADHLRSLGAHDVRIVPHGVDPFPWHPPRPREERLADAVVGFVGTLDSRIDPAVVRHVAQAEPGWRLRFIGVVQRGFTPGSIDDLPNVSVEPPVPNARLGEVLGSFDAGIMPYVDNETFRHMAPVKNFELMAAGRPAVARASPTLLLHEDLLRFATTPEEFHAQLRLALEEDGPELAARRRAVAEQNSWDVRMQAITALAREVGGTP
jgi:glycosyltransferase involved in cell wall biosynthesis